jgi:hypothetical protein
MPVTRRDSIRIVGPEGEVLLHRRLIDSSNVRWIGWPASGEPLLVVEFEGGGRYAYLGVSRQRAVAASWAGSTGKYINERIKPKHKVVKLK